MLALFSLLIFGRVVLGQYDPNCDGRTVIVHLFEWKWIDIAAECERFLAPKEFCGVQVSPPAEHISIDGSYPWWQRYQPVSYKLFSRSGTEAEFIDMVERCNAVGVRIYVDAVFNHMTGGDRVGTSPYANSTYDGGIFNYPAVPYNSSHFTPRSLCPSSTGGVDDYDDPANVRNCKLVGLTDLYGASADVQDKVAAYLNRLVDIGVAGIRVDTAKHMWPEDIGAILAKVNPLPTSHGFPPNSKLFVYQEVIDFNKEAIKSAEYFDTGLVMEFRYSRQIAEGIKNYSLLYNVFNPELNMAPSERAFVFVDTHDHQRNNYGEGDVLSFKRPSEYKQAAAFMLAHPYGTTMLMSSYNFTRTDEGPPGSAGITANITINDDGTCAGDWICEHRWRPIANMVRFRNLASGSDLNRYWNDGRSVAFAREGQCFFAMDQLGTLDRTFSTGLPEGLYCNLIDECDTTVAVDTNGTARIKINSSNEPIVAICVGDSTDLTTSATTVEPTTAGSTIPVADFRRTVIVIADQDPVTAGDYMFIQGGINSSQRPNCTENLNTSSCAIDIRIHSLGPSPHFNSYNEWLSGDSKLDWWGLEPGQGIYNGWPALGTAMGWTTNDPSSPAYHPLNVWGDSYWMVDVDLDCSQTEQGWFEVKAFRGKEQEGDIEHVCLGTHCGTPPYTSSHHMGRCGYLNSFIYNEGFSGVDPL